MNENSNVPTLYVSNKHNLPQDSRLQIFDSDDDPLQIPPPTSVKVFVLVFTVVPFPHVVEHVDQAPQEAH